MRDFSITDGLLAIGDSRCLESIASLLPHLRGRVRARAQLRVAMLVVVRSFDRRFDFG